MLYLLPFLLLVAQDQATFRRDFALVHVDADVRENGRVIADLGKDSFRVTDDGRPQAVVYFGHQEEPLDLILLFDGRDEIHPDIKRVAEASHTALTDLRQGDRVAIMVFGVTANNCKTDLILDFTGDFDAAEKSIANQVLSRDFGPQGSWLCSSQKGFANAARLFLGQPGGSRRRAIVVISDDKGAPTKPAVVRSTVRDLWQADAVVLGVLVHSGAVVMSIGPPYRGARYAASQTGGDTLNTNDAAEGLREMIHRLRSRYSLYYALPQGRPGEERKIRVQLTASAAKRYPKAVVRARAGYVVPDPIH